MMTRVSETVKIVSANPKASYLAHKEAIDTAVSRVLNSGWYILGEEVAAFEAEFAAWLGAKEAIGVANGTDALELALRAGGVGPGDAVLTVSNTAVATVAAIERCGAFPLFADIDPVTYTLDPNSLEEALRTVTTNPEIIDGRRPRAIIPVHLYGHPANMPAILEIAERYGLFVVEDCAQAHGALLNGRKVGTWGHIAAFSLYPTKNLGALGDGGIIATNDADLAGRVRLLRQYGWKERYISLIPGLNSRLDPLQAAILRVKLPHLDEENGRRQAWAAIYNEMLAATSLILPQTWPEATHVYHQYTIRSTQRDSLKSHLAGQNISTQILYPAPIHLQPAYQGRIPQVVALPRTEETAWQILSLPVFPELTAEQVHRVAEQILAWEGKAQTG